jgi:tetratricopeptide (TPR) repeat protein
MTARTAQFHETAPRSPVILAAILAVLLAAACAHAAVAVKRNVYTIEVTGGPDAAPWRLTYGTHFAGFSRDTYQLLDTGDRAYFSHGPWLRQIDTRRGVVTRRWRFPWSVVNVSMNGGKLQVEIAQAEDLAHSYKHIVVLDPDGDPQHQPIPNWPSSWHAVLVPSVEASQLRSISEAEEMIRRDPHTPWFRAQLGILLKSAGDPRFAQAFREAVAMPEADYTDLLGISARLWQLGVRDIAKEAFERGYRDFLDRGFDPRLVSSSLAREFLYSGHGTDLESVYRLGPYADNSSRAWEELAAQLEKRGETDHAKLWAQRARDPRSFDLLFPRSRWSMIEELCGGVVLAAVSISIDIYLLILFFRYRPQRRHDLDAGVAWYSKPGLTLFRLEYASRRERAAVLAMFLIASTAIGLIAGLHPGMERVRRSPATLWGGSLAGPANIAYLEEQAAAGKERNLLLAVASQQSGEDEKAERLYRDLPMFAESWNNLGVLLKQAGKGAEARSSFEQALRLDPGLAEAELNMQGTAKDEWTSQYARYFPGRPMLAVPKGDIFVKAFFGGSFAEMCLRALAGPLLLHPGMGLDELHRGQLLVGLAVILAWLLIIPQLRVSTPPGRLAFLGEALLPGSSRSYLWLGGLLGGLVMVCSAFLALLMRAPRYYLDRELWLNLYGVQATPHTERVILLGVACILLFGFNLVWVARSWWKQRGASA